MSNFLYSNFLLSKYAKNWSYPLISYFRNSLKLHNFLEITQFSKPACLFYINVKKEYIPPYLLYSCIHYIHVRTYGMYSVRMVYLSLPPSFSI